MSRAVSLIISLIQYHSCVSIKYVESEMIRSINEQTGFTREKGKLQQYRNSSPLN